MRSIITKNSVKCHLCEDKPTSRHRHDFKWCECGNIAADGGKAYLKRSGKGITDKTYTDLSEYANVTLQADMERFSETIPQLLPLLEKNKEEGPLLASLRNMIEENKKLHYHDQNHDYYSLDGILYAHEKNEREQG